VSRRIRAKNITNVALCAMLLGFCSVAQAQQPAKIPRIGYVSGTGDAKNPGPNLETFRQGLRDLGYIEGKNTRLNIGMLRARTTVTQSSWPNSSNSNSMRLSL
jgi:hypothetical protein